MATIARPILFAALLLAGCSGTTWERPNTSDAQRERDEASCMAQAERSDSRAATCMQGLGYQQADAGGMFGWLPGNR